MIFKNLEYLTEKIQFRLKEGLPGEEAQKRMMALPANLKRFDMQERIGARSSSVLILMYPREGEVYIPLIVRNDYNGAHSGQVGLPGGKKEEGDINLEDTALREAEEELGITRNDVQILGKLTDLYIPVSNFKVHPFLGMMGNEPQFQPDPYEVNQLIETPLRNLLNPELRKMKKIKVNKIFNLDAPYYDLENQTVWGATAMILSEFMHILEDIY